jgi:hypothetical protein
MQHTKCSKRGLRCAFAAVAFFCLAIFGGAYLSFSWREDMAFLVLAVAVGVVTAVVSVWLFARSDKHFTGRCRCPEEERQLENLYDRLAGSELR